MSTSILTAAFVATALTIVDPTAPHLTIGDVTEQAMAPYVWTMLGLCNIESGTARETCEWQDPSPHCQARLARRLPCDRARYMRGIWQNYGISPGEIFP